MLDQCEVRGWRNTLLTGVVFDSPRLVTRATIAKRPAAVGIIVGKSGWLIGRLLHSEGICFGEAKTPGISRGRWRHVEPDPMYSWAKTNAGRRERWRRFRRSLFTLFPRPRAGFHSERALYCLTAQIGSSHSYEHRTDQRGFHVALISELNGHVVGLRSLGEMTPEKIHQRVKRKRSPSGVFPMTPRMPQPGFHW